MAYTFSLAFLTVPDLSPLAAVEVAYAAGYQKLSVRLLPATDVEPTYPLLHDRLLARTIKHKLDDYGLALGEVELIWLTAEMDVQAFLPLFEQMAYLGARDVVVLSKDTHMPRMVEHLSLLAQLAAPFGIHLQLEAIPWTGLNQLENAIHILEQVKQPHCHLMIDSLHFYRMHHGGLDTLKAASAYVTHVQLCDASNQFQPAHYQDLRDEAKTGRLFPGDGELALRPLLAQCASDVTLSLEIPNRDYLSTYTALERAQRALIKTKTLLSL